MFSSNKNIETLKSLAADVKRYVDCQLGYTRADLASKLTMAFALLIQILVFFLLGSAVILFLSYMALQYLATAIGSTVGASLIVACVYLLLGLLVYWRRKAWIINPLASFWAKLLLKDEDYAMRK